LTDLINDVLLGYVTLFGLAVGLPALKEQPRLRLYQTEDCDI
jgi:hypothetical protein